MKAPILVADSLELGYDEEPSVLSDISFTLYRHDFVGISGPNGAGKTTFVRALLGLLKPRAGKVTYLSATGEEVPRLNVGYMPQQNVLDRTFPIAVSEVVRSGLYGSAQKLGGKKNDELVHQALEQVGLQDFSSRLIGKLSGGQLQRVLLARALVSAPEWLVLDEPTTFVDRSFEDSLNRLLPQLQQHSTIVMVSHNLPQLRALASRIIHVNHALTEE